MNEKINKSLSFFDKSYSERSLWNKKHWYYYQLISKYYNVFIPKNSRVLQIGSGLGGLLASLRPSYGVGIDPNPEVVFEARKSYPDLIFHQSTLSNIEDVLKKETFDYVVISNVVGHIGSLEDLFLSIKKFCGPSTRIIVDHYNHFWEPLLSLASYFGFRMKQNIQNWLSIDDLSNLLDITGFETVKSYQHILFPFHIPFLSSFINRFISHLPLIEKFNLCRFVGARLKPNQEISHKSVSVVVPCLNEKGHIQPLIERLPAFDKGVEYIFVDGGSNDGTLEAVERGKEQFPEKNIKIIKQNPSHSGKGYAVRLGFEEAKNEIFMILDSDLSVAPEDLIKFYEVVVSNTADFANGNRLVYPMEKNAMRFLNNIGNRTFGWIFTYLLNQRIKDTLCGTKAFFREDYQKIAFNRTFFGDFDPFGDFDLLFGAAKLNLKIAEVPIKYYERQYGTTKIHRFRHGFLLFKMCLIAMRKIKFI